LKKYNNLFSEITSFRNLLLASRNARKSKRHLTYVAKFEMNLENELHQLKEELLTKTYQPGNYREFLIYVPKKRMISAAPYRDRIVHHAVCNVIEPIFERSFIHDSYANRKGKGTHLAINRFEEFARKNKYVLKCDLSKYFPSIDHRLLKTVVREKIICSDTLWLIDKIIDNSNAQQPVYEYFSGDDLFTPFERRRGIPIGNLTSQFLANVFLNKLDHYIKEKLHCKNYLRYVDDFVLFSNNKRELWHMKKEIDLFLDSFRLSANKNKTKIYHTENGVKFLGFKLFKDFRLIQRENIVRAKKRFARIEQAIIEKKVDKDFVIHSVNGWLGHAVHANTFKLVQKMQIIYPLTFRCLTQ